ncbi:hypothetical protein [Thioalkalivibrio sulfidiphilus]|uniref:hypothetical protein n=1 Tax=Thioalkalivibrio sulfidiphilus TaxID=1033854 RepID=UPI003B3396C9
MSRPDEPRLHFLMDTVAREGRHLIGTTGRLFSQVIDKAWIENLDNEPELAERLDAFVARFGRMQDTLGEKLVPELMRHMQETPGAVLDNLNRMEKLGLLKSALDWVEARNLRNRLVHEYMRDPAEFAQALQRARERVALLVDTYNRILDYVLGHFPSDAVSHLGKLKLPT